MNVLLALLHGVRRLKGSQLPSFCSLPFPEHFSRVRPPKVLLTTCYKPSKIMYTFLSEMLVRPRMFVLKGLSL